jgi:hypothetical protein
MPLWPGAGPRGQLPPLPPGANHKVLGSWRSPLLDRKAPQWLPPHGPSPPAASLRLSPRSRFSATSPGNRRFDAIPDAEQETPAELEDPLRLRMGLGAILEKHCAKLAAHGIEPRIGKWQRMRIRLLPGDAAISFLPLRSVVQHRLIEVCRHVLSIGGELGRQSTAQNPRSRRSLKNRRRRKRGGPLRNPRRSLRRSAVQGIRRTLWESIRRKPRRKQTLPSPGGD